MKTVDRFVVARWYDFIDRDVERLLTGQEPHNSDLAPLKSLVRATASMADTKIPSQFIADHAAVAAATVAMIRRPVVATSAPETIRSFGSRMWNRFATGVAGLAILTGLSSIAVASNAAVPGDWNYGIDQALERVGIGAGGQAERLEELAEMNQKGDSREVLEHTSAALSQGGHDRASDALRASAERVESNDGGADNADAVHLQVAELLRYLSENQGRVDGQEVAEIARQIGNGENQGQGQGQNQGQGSNSNSGQGNSQQPGKGQGKDK